MLLKLIKTRSFISGSHCEVWEINHLTGNRLLGEVFVLNEHLPLELIYRVTISLRGICIQGRHCGWQWKSESRVRQQAREDQTTPLIGKSDLCLRSPHSKQPTASVYSGDPDEIEKAVTDYLRTIQECREEIRIEVCQPTPDLPGYPEVDYHPKDAPIVLIDDLPEDERPEEPVIIPLYD